MKPLQIQAKIKRAHIPTVGKGVGIVSLIGILVEISSSLRQEAPPS
jgi:hypothetical protein